MCNFCLASLQNELKHQFVYNFIITFCFSLASICTQITTKVQPILELVKNQVNYCNEVNLFFLITKVCEHYLSQYFCVTAVYWWDYYQKDIFVLFTLTCSNPSWWLSPVKFNYGHFKTDQSNPGVFFSNHFKNGHQADIMLILR